MAFQALDIKINRFKKIIKKINDTSNIVDTLNKKSIQYVEVFLYENL